MIVQPGSFLDWLLCRLPVWIGHYIEIRDGANIVRQFSWHT